MNVVLRVLFAALALLGTPPVTAAERMQAHLVLALDCSESVTIPRWSAQLRGYSEAFRSPDIIAALARGVAVTVVVWSGPDEQVQILPWTRLYDTASSHAFAHMIERIPKTYSGYTNIGSAIEFSTHLLVQANPDNVIKRIIDISGDGQHRESSYPNAIRGVPLEIARARAMERDITINGLPIEGDEFGISDYFRNHVIVGHGAFIETVSNPDDTAAFERAIQRKLLRELLASAQ